MKSFLLALAAVLAACQSLFAFSGSGTLASPYQLGSVATTGTFQCSGLASGTAAKYYQFKSSTIAAVGSSIEVQYDASAGVAYKLALYQGSTTLTGTYSAVGSGTQVRNRVTLTSALAAGSYKISIARNPATGGTAPNFSIVFNLSQTRIYPVPINDDVRSPLGFTGFGGVKTANNSSATKQSGEPNHAGDAGGKSIWYAWVAPTNGDVVISTAGSGFDTLLAVYTLPNGYLQSVASNNDEGNGLKTSKVKFTAQQSAVYYIAVDGKGGASGDVVIALAQGGTAPNPPLNLTPSNNLVDCSPSSTLKSSAYNDANYFNDQVGSEWVVRRASDNSVVAKAYTSGSANTVAMSGLPLGTVLRWNVRQLNDAGLWSSFSPSTTFTVAPSWPPSLSVSVVNALPIQVPLHSGRVRITRTGSAKATTVRYSLSGATNGVDFVQLPGSITIPAGAAYADIPIVPIPISNPAKKKPLTVTLQPLSGFPIGAGSATLSIRSELVPACLVAYDQNTFRMDLDGLGGTAEKTVSVPTGTSQVLFGDFNKDGVDDLVLQSGTTFKVVTITGPNLSTTDYSFGANGDTAFIGDLDGDGRDDLITRNGSGFKADTGHNGGAAEVNITFGPANAELVLCSDGVRTGDWDGDGRDDIVLRSGNLFLVRCSKNGSIVQFTFGEPSDAVYLADLNGDGKVEPVLWRGASYIADINHNQKSPKTINFGTTSDYAFAADLDGDGLDELIIQRGSKFLIDYAHDGGVAEQTLTFGNVGDTVVPMRER
ncbi:MAG: hypothetical protein WCP06_12635 [Verrucomicrobiota bacterium]